MKKLALYIILCFGSLMAIAQTTVIYPAIPELRTSTDFSTTVNGRSAWTEVAGAGGMEDLNIVNFSCEGTQAITITASQEIASYQILPKSAAIKAHTQGRELSFTLDGPRKLYIKINNLPHLAVFANPLETDAPKPNAENVVYFGPGKHDVGKIELQSDQTIYIAGGAHVVANVAGTGAKNVKICGRGSLLGNVRVTSSDNFWVEGISIRHTKGWANTLSNCSNSGYNNVKVFTYEGVWGLDGINPVSCKKFDITDCFIRTRDDCIAIKSNGRRGGSGYDLSTRDITVSKSLLIGWDHADGVTLGFELNGGTVEHVLVKDCDILRAWGNGRSGGHSAFSIVCDGPSQVSDICFEDIRVENDIEYKNMEIILTEGERYGNGKMGTIQGVHMKNVTWENRLKPFTIVGHPTRFVENITFTNCYVGGKLLTGLDDAQFQIEFARDIKFIPGGEADRSRYPENKE